MFCVFHSRSPILKSERSGVSGRFRNYASRVYEIERHRRRGVGRVDLLVALFITPPATGHRAATPLLSAAWQRSRRARTILRVGPTGNRAVGHRAPTPATKAGTLHPWCFPRRAFRTPNPSASWTFSRSKRCTKSSRDGTDGCSRTLVRSWERTGNYMGQFSHASKQSSRSWS